MRVHPGGKAALDSGIIEIMIDKLNQKTETETVASNSHVETAENAPGGASTTVELAHANSAGAQESSASTRDIKRLSENVDRPKPGPASSKPGYSAV